MGGPVGSPEHAAAVGCAERGDGQPVPAGVCALPPSRQEGRVRCAAARTPTAWAGRRLAAGAPRTFDWLILSRARTSRHNTTATVAYRCHCCPCPAPSQARDGAIEGKAGFGHVPFVAHSATALRPGARSALVASPMPSACCPPIDHPLDQFHGIAQAGDASAGRGRVACGISARAHVRR